MNSENVHEVLIKQEVVESDVPIKVEQNNIKCELGLHHEFHIKEELQTGPVINDFSNDIFKCEYCNHSSKSQRFLRVHCFLIHDKVIALTQHNSKTNNCNSIKYESNDSFDKDEQTEKFNESVLWYKCKECDFKCMYKHILKEHSTQHNKYTCTECPYSASNIASLHMHKFRAHPLQQKDSYEGDQNHFKTIHMDNLRAHLLAHNRVNSYKCTQCSYETDSLKYLQNHIKEIHSTILTQNQCIDCNHTCGCKMNYKDNFNDTEVRVKKLNETEWYKCKKCDFKCIYKYLLIEHNTQHISNNFVCSQCSFNSDDVKSLKMHKLRKHPSTADNYECDQCPYKATNKEYLTRHLLKHNSGNSYKCTQCDFQTYYRTYLHKHTKRKHSVHSTQYQCTDCNYKSVFLDNFKRHILIHIAIKYQCQYCGYITLSESKYKEHLLKHPSFDLPPEYECFHCNFKTSYKGSLKKHLLRHGKADTYKCTKCDYKTFYKHYLNRHMLKHCVNAKEYKCTQCDYKTVYKDYLKTHLIHQCTSSVKVYKCPQCEYKSVYPFHFKKHLLKHNLVKVTLTQFLLDSK